MPYVKWPCKLFEETPLEFGLTEDQLLPDYVSRDNFTYGKDSGIIRTDMDAGYPKTRRRFTATLRNYTISMVMTTEQTYAFEDFIFNSPVALAPPGILDGSLPFYFPDPRWKPGEGETEADRPAMLVRLVAPSGSELYTINPETTANDWSVSFNLERLPGM